MDDFISTVESQVFGLSTLDAFTSYINLQYVFFYGNPSDDAGFMRAETLKRAFYTALEQFPILVGHYHQRSDHGLNIVVDKGKLNMPDYRESVSDTVHYKDLKARKFHRDAWPKNLMTAHTMAHPDKGTRQIKLCHVNIVRLKENSGVVIYLAINHGVADANSYFQFAHRWANIARAMVRNEPIPAANFCFGISELASTFPAERASLDTQLGEYFGKENFASRLMARLSPNTRAKLLSFGTRQIKVRGALFRVPKQNVESLRMQVLQCTPPGTHISENDVITAVMSKVIAQAVRDLPKKSTGFGDSVLSRLRKRQESRLVTVACDIRYRLGITNMKYIGNGQFLPTLWIPVDKAVATITPESLYEIAMMTRQA
ncbi:hypothetical protein FBU59_005653, partial [Linderina macrospora]